MKFLFLSILLVFQVSVFAQSEGDSWKSVQQKGEGTLAILYYECPKLIEDVNGTPQGLCVDVLNEFAQYVKAKYNKTVELKYHPKETDFGQFLQTVKSSGNIVGVSNTTITEDRKAEMKFSPYFLKTPLVILTNKAAPNYNSMKDLMDAGLAGQVEKETSYAAFLEALKAEQFPKLSIQYQETTPAVLSQLSAGNKFFSVMDFTEYLGEVKLNTHLKRQPINLGSNMPLGFVMSKKSDWDVLFNEFLTDNYRNSTPYKKSIASNLGANFMSLVKQ